MPNFQTYGAFTKVDKLDDGTLRAYAVINDETVDDQGEVMDYAGTKAALDDFMKWANLREMHQHSAVGVVEAITHDDIAKVSAGILHIVDPTAVMKVETGVYKGTSLGGSKGMKRATEKVGGASVVRLLEPHVVELSLVDRPSRPTAVLSLLKITDAERVDNPPATDSQEEPPVTDETKEAAAEAGDLEKSASDDLTSVHIAKEQIARLLEKEAAEGDPAQTGALQAALAALNNFEAAEQTELAEPDNVADAEEEAAAEVPVVIEMAYAAVIGDLAKQGALAKVGKRNNTGDQKSLEQIHDLAVAAGAYPDAHKAAPAEEEEEPAEKMAKVAAEGPSPEAIAEAVMEYVTERVSLAKAADLAAMKAELLTEMAKIAAQPMPGGPLRYAESERFAEAPVAGAVAASLSKISDPTVRDEVRRALATEMIVGIHNGK